MNTWKVILATMVIFGAGVVTGGLLVRYALGRPPFRTPVARPAPPVSASGLRLEFLRRMQRELDLNAEQREHIDKLLKESQDRSRKILEPVAPNLRAEFERTKNEFREVLAPEQRAHFDELLRHQQHPRDQKRPAPTRERTPIAAPLTNGI